MRALVGQAFVALDREADACQLLDVLAARDFDDIRPNVRWVKNLVEIAGLAYALGDVERSKRLAAMLAPFEHLHAILPVPIGYGGPVSYALARLRETLGDFEAAGDLYAEAFDAAEALGARPTAARILIDHAALLARRGDRRGARERAERGVALAETFGMVAVVARGQEIAAR
jgi:hypothetical protein